jgi:hypothetical protein
MTNLFSVIAGLPDGKLKPSHPACQIKYRFADKNDKILSIFSVLF